ncbi:MAG: retropepsin-like aspartic protease [Desulfobacterales bacterium]
MSAPVIYNYKPLSKIKIPSIALGIFYDRKWARAEALVDTGATYSVFSSEVADTVGLKYQKGKKIPLINASGDKFYIYLNQVKVQIGKHVINAMLGFSDGLCPYNLLGRKDIFENFKICFDEKNSQILFYPFA